VARKKRSTSDNKSQPSTFADATRADSRQFGPWPLAAQGVWPGYLAIIARPKIHGAQRAEAFADHPLNPETAAKTADKRAIIGGILPSSSVRFRTPTSGAADHDTPELKPGTTSLEPTLHAQPSGQGGAGPRSFGWDPMTTNASASSTVASPRPSRRLSLCH